MGPLLFLLAVLLLFTTLVSLFVPRKALFFIPKPSRAKVLLYYGIPAIVLLIVGLIMTPSRLAEALENPMQARTLSLSGKRLSVMPEEVLQLKVLEELDLSNNRLGEVPEGIRSLTTLVSLDLSENPLSELPLWLSEMPNLKTIVLYQTAIDSVPAAFSAINVEYQKRSEEVDEEELMAGNQTTDESDDKRTESFGEYAKRRLLGNDFGHKRKFKKGEVYYDHPVTKETADKVGELLLIFGFFNDERATTVILAQAEEAKPVRMKMVIDESKLNDEVLDAFLMIKTMVKETAFPDDELDLILVDSDLDEVETL